MSRINKDKTINLIASFIRTSYFLKFNIIQTYKINTSFIILNKKILSRRSIIH